MGHGAKDVILFEDALLDPFMAMQKSLRPYKRRLS